MASREVRSLVYKLLPLWGSIKSDGPLGKVPGVGSSGGFESMMPEKFWFFDLSRAFAALNPQTVGLSDRGDDAWMVHLPFNDMQRVVWAYYVEGADEPLDMRRADKQQWAHDREREVAKAVKERGWRVDDEIARRLHLTGRNARTLRTEAVWLMSDLVKWDEDVAA